jgi:hypothetical protein
MEYYILYNHFKGLYDHLPVEGMVMPLYFPNIVLYFRP